MNFDVTAGAKKTAKAVVEVVKKAGVAVANALTVEVPQESKDELKRRAEINARGDAIRAERAAVLDRAMGGRRPWIRPARGWMARGR